MFQKFFKTLVNWIREIIKSTIAMIYRECTENIMISQLTICRFMFLSPYWTVRFHTWQLAIRKPSIFRGKLKSFYWIHWHENNILPSLNKYATKNCSYLKFNKLWQSGCDKVFFKLFICSFIWREILLLNTEQLYM